MSEPLEAVHLPDDAWNPYWQRISKANLLQSPQYGLAKELAEGWQPLRYLIRERDRRPVAIAQILVRRLPVLGGVARLNRGPLLIETLPEGQAVATSVDALVALIREARRRRWWVFQIAPELPDTEEVRRQLAGVSLSRRLDPPWASGLLALDAGEDSLLSGFNGKWRNCMRKGERLGVQVSHHSCCGKALELLLAEYSKFQRSKGFVVLSVDMLKGLARQQGENWQLNLFLARNPETTADENPVGLLLSVRHGDTSTYLIGSSNDQGRRLQANSVLLWQAILYAKRSGSAWFDIGGLSSITPKGVAEFKAGLNAVPYALAGEWRWYNLPWRRIPA